MNHNLDNTGTNTATSASSYTVQSSAVNSTPITIAVDPYNQIIIHPSITTTLVEPQLLENLTITPTVICDTLSCESDTSESESIVESSEPSDNSTEYNSLQFIRRFQSSYETAQVETVDKCTQKTHTYNYNSWKIGAMMAGGTSVLIFILIIISQAYTETITIEKTECARHRKK